MITNSLLHFEPGRLILNMCTLHSFGPIIVTLLGPQGFLWLWMGSSIMASTATLLWDLFLEQSSPFHFVKFGPIWDWHAFVVARHSFGASGSTLGLFMAFRCIMPNSMVLCPIPLPAWQAAILLSVGSVYCLVGNVLPGIGHAAHLGGMAFGAAYYHIYGIGKM